MDVLTDEPGVAVADDFAEWVGPHLGVLSAIAVREVGRTDADDLVQETLTRAWLKWTTYRPERGSARGWLVAVLIDRARRHRVRHPWRPAVPPVPATPTGAMDARLDVERAVRALPRRQRQVVTLHYLADLAVDDVAAALGISAGSVKSCLHDARIALRTALEQR